ncbi:TraR/DksA family transcriptional regulator [Flexivirga sp. ID2601S]|uniref:TraR/DksA family transcriptional regulator n=1 Tax=Flexivirga aerilata TaxID=1656889 RepID=A0A849AGU3_9MICO|nr:TraR/DksA C4-type zinc finger protein [Flexivirga aerilata]NNG40064.1 TraR/DksA family transcriptional regulator [Flexivirga aerilata]
MDDEVARARLRELGESADARLRELRASFDDVVEALRDSNADDEHDPEGRTIAVDRSMIDTLAKDAAAQRVAVDAALARLADGSYGVCERCGAPIGDGRLEARPTTTFCIDCARAS